MARFPLVDELSFQNGLSYPTATTTASLLVGSILVTLVFSYVQKLLSCQLSSVDGPFWTKFSNLDMLIAMIRKRRVHRLLELHQKYGSVVRIGPKEVSVADWKSYRPIYSNRSTTKDRNFYSPAMTAKENIFQMTDRDQHAARRKLSNPNYTQSSVTVFNPVVRRNSDQLISDLLKETAASPSGTANAYKHAGLYSFKTICHLALAKEFDADEAQKLLDAMNDSIYAILLDGALPWLRCTGIARKFPGVVGESFRKHDQWVGKTAEMVNDLLRSSSESDKYFLTPVYNGVDNSLGRKLNHDERVAEAMTIQIGGSDTVAIGLTYLLYELSRPENNHIQKRLREEVLSLPDDLSIVRKNAYVKAVIDETLRLHPPIASSLPRLLLEPMKVGDYVLPEGTVVGMQNYIHHRNPEIYPEPLVWDPDRWLNPSEDMIASFTPFSIGKRNCIGLNLAWEELYSAINSFARARVEIKLGKEMKSSDMEVEDRWLGPPRAGKLMVEVLKL